MMFWDTFQNLCNSHNTTPSAVVKELKIASGSITKWKNGSIPSNKSIALIANHFNVSIDSLLNNGPMPELLQKSESEWDIILDGLSEESLVQLRDYLKFLHWKQSQAPEDSK